MPIRELTEDEKERLLTQEEVNALPDETTVMVKWSGGNGPHEYEIEQFEGYPHPYIGKTPLTKVTEDPESGLTKVFFPEDNDG